MRYLHSNRKSTWVSLIKLIAPSFQVSNNTIEERKKVNREHRSCSSFTPHLLFYFVPRKRIMENGMEPKTRRKGKKKGRDEVKVKNLKEDHDKKLNVFCTVERVRWR